MQLNALFHGLVELAQVGDLVVNSLGLHEVAEEQTSHAVVSNSAALRQVSEHFVNAHLVAALTDVAHVREERLPDVVPKTTHKSRSHIVLSILVWLL